MQSFATEQQLDACSAMKSRQTTQINDAGIVDNGNGAEEEDREEGEIVDEFEMIISSEDEEFKLRARIQQLEDKSKDIEKMNMLSANLANQYSKYYHKLLMKQHVLVRVCMCRTLVSVCVCSCSNKMTLLYD